MSRYSDVVTLEQFEKAIGDPLKDPQLSKPQKKHIKKLLKDANGDKSKVQLIVAHGYDRPCVAYFCDLEPDDYIGIYYGKIGLTTQLDRATYAEAMKTLDLVNAYNAVMMDTQY